MATAPVKSQPLHNFNLPSFLKWGGAKSHTAASHHRFRRPLSSSSADSPPPPPPDHSEAESDKNDSETEGRPHRVGSRSARTHRFTFASCSLADKPHKQTAERDASRTTNNNNEPDEAAPEAEETAHKPWNLRPRKPISSKTTVNGEFFQDAASGVSLLSMPAPHHQRDKERDSDQRNEPKSMRLRGFAADGHGPERKEKRKFWIALSKEEIEEDVFIMTGSRPSRRPRKRPKNVQRQLDSVFPGLWLVGITADAYRVADAPAKR